MRAAERSPAGQSGASLVELLIASFIGIMALLGVLYLYKNQHKHALIQGSISEMRMNGQFTLNEAQYYLSHSGLGLPSSLPYLLVSNGELVIRMNTTRKSASAAKTSGSTTQIVYDIANADTAIFSKKAYAVGLVGGNAVEAPIKSVAARQGFPGRSLITLAADQASFPASTMLYPTERVRLRLRTGTAPDTIGKEFLVLEDNPNLRPGLKQDSLALAAGIDSLSFRYVLADKSVVSALPSNLAVLQRVQVTVVVRNLVRDRRLAGDGYRRQTLKATVNYRRTM